MKNPAASSGVSKSERLGESQAQQAAGYQKTFMRIFLKVVTPECFNRGSSQNFAWIPAKNMRE